MKRASLGFQSPGLADLGSASRKSFLLSEPCRSAPSIDWGSLPSQPPHNEANKHEVHSILGKNKGTKLIHLGFFHEISSFCF